MTYKLTKKVKPKKPRMVSVIIEDNETWMALGRAKRDSGKPKTKLIHEMLKHCLIESGYMERD